LAHKNQENEALKLGRGTQLLLISHPLLVLAFSEEDFTDKKAAYLCFDILRIQGLLLQGIHLGSPEPSYGGARPRSIF